VVGLAEKPVQEACGQVGNILAVSSSYQWNSQKAIIFVSQKKPVTGLSS